MPNSIHVKPGNFQAMFRLEESETSIQDWDVARVALGHYQDVWGLVPHPNR